MQSESTRAAYLRRMIVRIEAERARVSKILEAQSEDVTVLAVIRSLDRQVDVLSAELQQLENPE